jgi:hypothetical protein
MTLKICTSKAVNQEGQTIQWLKEKEQKYETRFVQISYNYCTYAISAYNY